MSVGELAVDVWTVTSTEHEPPGLQPLALRPTELIGAAEAGPNEGGPLGLGVGAAVAVVVAVARTVGVAVLREVAVAVAVGASPAAGWFEPRPRKIVIAPQSR